MKQFSDVTLKVKERRFHVLKLYLSYHSPYFATLFLGKFQESEKSEIELKDVDPQDFQYYLEAIYAENGIDEGTVQGILSVADMFDTPLIVKKCEEFLVKESKKELKEKLELAGNYRLEELKTIFCMNVGNIFFPSDFPDIILSIILLYRILVKVIDGNFSEEKYNQFFRMWMNGSAPRMEHLHVATVNLEIDEKALMKELDCHGATMDVYRKQPNRPGYLHDQLVTRPKDGGVCIVRRDGNKAVVTVENNKLEFFVFHPKCYHNDFDWIF
ncbi:hypothetical protein B9Z55_007618 [Caenorhabditis nigoni]|uniref:BTB domain-containing protein n=1 Tax=Caenorhabditis nigoni TaxID=1611254 RepID=A0A2G5VAE5_9PELO|nr:hypothetical protein B9Z55_007618 [Caenorhabditis nigoni]